MILWLNLLGLCVGALVGVAILLVTGGSWVLVAMTVGLVGHQTATAALFFHGKRIWLYWCSWPAASGGLVFLVAGQPEPVKRGAAAAAAASVVLLLVVSAVFGVRAARQPGDEPALPAPLRLRPRRLALGPWLPGAGWALLAAALSAAYLLTAQTVFLLDSLDVTAGLLGLFACMGLVEWRAAGFGFHVRELMTRVRYPHELRDGIPVLVLRDVGLCAAAAAVAGAMVGGALLAFGRLGAEGVLVVMATVPLSACYLNCFVLANLEEYPWLCGSLAVGLVLQLGLGAQPWLSWAAAFLVSSTVLLVVLLVGVVASPRPVRSFR